MHKSAASLVSRFFLNMSFIMEAMKSAVPSIPLSRILPEKPSETTTSAPPSGTSRASMLPVKLIFPASPACFSSG